MLEAATVDDARLILLQRELRVAELGLDRARERIAAAEREAAHQRQEAGRLERALEESRAEPERLSARLRESESLRLAAEQRAHSECSRRLELQDELDGLVLQLARQGEVDPAEDERAGRLRDLEREVARLERALVEAGHALAAARRGDGSGERGHHTPAAPSAPRGTARAPALPGLSRDRREVHEPPTETIEVDRLAAAFTRLREEASPGPSPAEPAAGEPAEPEPMTVPEPGEARRGLSEALGRLWRGR